jgi:hypothetical protein
MEEKERKHNSLAKLSGYPNQTVGTRVDEDLNERLIKNEPCAHDVPFSREPLLSWQTGHRRLWLCAAISERAKRSETNDPI